ncbi:MAG: NAD(+)/NADH kinase [Candidatus Pacebacteria bacterium]|nr:NAD(+)/NADH kinase [Candidatus Paceibacterota bacterium]
MHYFIDFDRTIFDTDRFKRDVAKRPPLKTLLSQVGEIVREFFSSTKTISRRRILSRSFGTYASHGRFSFLPADLQQYLYPDVVPFLEKYGENCTVVTYGVRAFITAKVTTALSGYNLKNIVYTRRKKGRTIRRLCKDETGPFMFIDDAVFQLVSVQAFCPFVEVREMRRGGGSGDGRWPVLHSLNDISTQATHEEISVSSLRIAAILNTASGSCDAGSEEVLTALLREYQANEYRIWCGDASYMEEAYKEMKQYAPEVLIVLGGDGTIRAGAEACTSKGPLLVPLPGGTMNMLPKALYGEGSWEEVLRNILESARIKSVSGASANGKQFFIAAVLGAPALWARAREALREGSVGSALEEGGGALEQMFTMKVKYQFSDTEKGETDAVSVICPLISEVLPDSEHTLEAAAISVESATEALGLASTAAFGTWRDDRRVSIVKTKRVSVSCDQDIPLILDGETTHAGTSVDITFLPEAFKALVPHIKK